jgi:hypothetical protein
MKDTPTPGIRQVFDYIYRIFSSLSFLGQTQRLVHHNLIRLASFDSSSGFNFECAYDYLALSPAVLLCFKQISPSVHVPH